MNSMIFARLLSVSIFQLLSERSSLPTAPLRFSGIRSLFVFCLHHVLIIYAFFFIFWNIIFYCSKYTLFLGTKYKDSRNIGNRPDYQATFDSPLTELQVFPPHFQFTCNQNVIRSLVCFNVFVKFF